MIKNIKIGKVIVARSGATPASLSPLLDAVEAGEPLEPVLTIIVKNFGFDSFMFGLSVSPEMSHESQSYVFTTLPIEWVVRYDQMDYIEIDHRLIKTRDNPLPLIWDQRSERGVNPRTDAFLDDCAAHGIASGVAYEFRDTHFVHGLLALNSSNPVMDDSRRAAVGRN